MDLANGGHARNGGGVVDAEERRSKTVAQEAVVHGLLDREKGDSSMPIHQPQQQEEEEARLICSLLTESEALEEEGIGLGDRAEQNSVQPNHHLPAEKGRNSKEAELADIARDLNKIKGQNTITHVLLGTVIVLTAVWQVNEVSFLLWVQKKLSNPFKSLGDLVKGSLKLNGRRPVIESSPLPPVGVPDVTRAGLPTLVISGEHR